GSRRGARPGRPPAGGPRQAEGRVGERAAGQERDVGQRGVAVEDLDDEPAEDGDGGQQAVAPAVAGAAAGVVDGGLVEAGVEVPPESSQGGIDSVMHPRASRYRRREAMSGCQEASESIKSFRGPELAARLERKT